MELCHSEVELGDYKNDVATLHTVQRFLWGRGGGGPRLPSWGGRPGINCLGTRRVFCILSGKFDRKLNQPRRFTPFKVKGEHIQYVP